MMKSSVQLSRVGGKFLQRLSPIEGLLAIESSFEITSFFIAEFELVEEKKR